MAKNEKLEKKQKNGYRKNSDKYKKQLRIKRKEEVLKEC